MYFPKNKILTNLYTNGSISTSPLTNVEKDTPLIIKETGEIYIGYYWKDYQGKYYSGKNPSTPPTQELTFPQPIETPPKTKTQIIPLSQYSSPPKEIEYNPIIISEYTRTTQRNTNSIKRLPTQHYVTPTTQDYTIGNFKRYFVIKTNELSYLEIDKKTYDNLISGNSNWAYELYLPFSIIWELKGTEEQVGKTNENIVTLTEQRLRKRGLKEFLRRNYTKFWLPQ